MRVFMLGIAVAIAAILPTNVNADDRQIAEYIKQRLQTEQQRGNLRGFNVDMRVDKGTVWFKGFVANRDQELLMLRTAQTAGHLGVVQVVDDIEVNGQTMPTMQMPSPQQFNMQQNLAQQHSMFMQAANNMNTQVAYQEPVLRANPVQNVQPTPPFSTQQTIAPPAPSWQQTTMPQSNMPQMSNVGTPVRSQQPLAFASAKAPCVGQGCDTYGGAVMMGGDHSGAPMAMDGGYGGGMTMESPSLPGYAWPGYAASPNYAAVTYPQQYSPSAWPYIGPFYPYPQVPLGWRKVSLEWDDGWWFLDFNDKSQW